MNSELESKILICSLCSSEINFQEILNRLKGKILGDYLDYFSKSGGCFDCYNGIREKETNVNTWFNS